MNTHTLFGKKRWLRYTAYKFRSSVRYCSKIGNRLC